MSAASNLRDQIAALTIDIDDKEKVCSLLRRKIDKERDRLSGIEPDVAEEYTGLIKVWICIFYDSSYCVCLSIFCIINRRKQRNNSK